MNGLEAGKRSWVSIVEFVDKSGRKGIAGTMGYERSDSPTGIRKAHRGDSI
jgi:hypothetical protein